MPFYAVFRENLRFRHFTKNAVKSSKINIFQKFKNICNQEANCHHLVVLLEFFENFEKIIARCYTMSMLTCEEQGGGRGPAIARVVGCAMRLRGEPAGRSARKR